MSEKSEKSPLKNEKSAREIALETVYQVLEKEAFANLSRQKTAS